MGWSDSLTSHSICHLDFRKSRCRQCSGASERLALAYLLSDAEKPYECCRFQVRGTDVGNFELLFDCSLPMFVSFSSVSITGCLLLPVLKLALQPLSSVELMPHKNVTKAKSCLSPLVQMMSIVHVMSIIAYSAALLPMGSNLLCYSLQGCLG